MSVRRIALLALLDITEGGAYANLRLKEAERGLPRQDAKWVSAAVYETLDHLIYIDYVLSRYTKGRQKPAIRGILRMGVCQVMFMGSSTMPRRQCISQGCSHTRPQTSGSGLFLRMTLTASA